MVTYSTLVVSAVRSVLRSEMRFLTCCLLGFTCTLSFAAQAQMVDKRVIESLKRQGVQPEREVSFDLCYPASYQEYAALGKNAILMMHASSVIANELPLTATYVGHDGVVAPLEEIARSDPKADGKGGASQDYFSLIPIAFLKRNSRIIVDFTGGRKGFVVASYSAAEGLEKHLPAQIRLDQHDSPGQADPMAIAAILTREYPSYFGAIAK